VLTEFSDGPVVTCYNYILHEILFYHSSAVEDTDLLGCCALLTDYIITDVSGGSQSVLVEGAAVPSIVKTLAL
jgi:hypothetical protein